MEKQSKEWDAHIQNYLSYLHFERGYSKSTVEAYMRDVRQLREHIDQHFSIAPTEIKRTHLESFMSSIYDRRMESSSQSRILSGINNFFDYLHSHDLTESSPTEFIDNPKIERKLPDVLSVEQIDAICSTIDLSTTYGHRNKAIIETLYGAGLRVSELSSLRLGDLFFKEGVIRVTGKGDKQRLVPINRIAIKNIELYLEQRATMKVSARSADILFLNHRGSKLSRVSIFNIVKQGAARAGISKSVSPHSLRHSFATHLLAGGANIRQVQQMLGHESILTTEIYTHLDIKHLSKTIEEHHPLGESQAGQKKRD